MNYFMIRGGYSLESFTKKTSTDYTTNEVVSTILVNGDSFFLGPSVGATAVVPLKKGNTGARIYLDYAYRFTSKWRGNHLMGIKITL